MTATKNEPIDFYFSIGSMYTFLTVMRMDRVEDVTDIRFVWRPFSVRDIMIEMDNRPMSKPLKLAYMWRDLHRRAEMYGFAFEGEAPYPLKEFDLANRVALV
ncbi:MAG: DsbA family protein, partial [Alphaproteobacteria bacterium]|nr:DsbA family protein [Alphaproteobacteria bacterium]